MSVLKVRAAVYAHLGVCNSYFTVLIWFIINLVETSWSVWQSIDNTAEHFGFCSVNNIQISSVPSQAGLTTNTFIRDSVVGNIPSLIQTFWIDVSRVELIGKVYKVMCCIKMQIEAWKMELNSTRKKYSSWFYGQNVLLAIYVISTKVTEKKRLYNVMNHIKVKWWAIKTVTTRQRECHNPYIRHNTSNPQSISTIKALAVWVMSGGLSFLRPCDQRVRQARYVIVIFQPQHSLNLYFQYFLGI